MQQRNKFAWSALFVVLLLPLVSIAIVPLYDTSEPRYAEIARIMAESGDWITPWFTPGQPFWGKPPFSFWAQALSIKAFGTAEFAVRLPSWLCLIASSGILLCGIRAIYGLRIGLSSVIIYGSSALVYISSGAVLTDPFLALGTTLCLMSFAVAVQGGGTPGWRYGFFIGLSIGLLAKGPLAAVLSLMPVLVWNIFNRKTRALWKTLPWHWGLILTAAAVLPWYVMAEAKTPGFLDYFIVGEHYRRFLDPGWAGDLYGSAHRRAYGTIWLYWLQASFPWSLVVLASILGALLHKPLRPAVGKVCSDHLFCYWLAGALTAPCFFTFSANILWTYVLPSLAGFSVLTALLVEQMRLSKCISRRVVAAVVAIVPVVVLILSMAAWIKPDLRNTERTLIHYVKQQPGPGLPLFYLSETPFSARFYSTGQAREISQDGLRDATRCGAPFYLAVPKAMYSSIDVEPDTSLVSLYSNKRYVLLKVSPVRRCNP